MENKKPAVNRFGNVSSFCPIDNNRKSAHEDIKLAISTGFTDDNAEFEKMSMGQIRSTTKLFRGMRL